MTVGNGAAASGFVRERFVLNPITRAMLAHRPEPWDRGYGVFSEFIFWRTYSRDGERWYEVIIRVIEGTFSIRKDYFAKTRRPWDEAAEQARAHEMARSAYDGEWGPPGRGYWAMGTELIYGKGGMALNNCGYVEVKDLGRDVHWAMDGLMMGVGIGFSTWHEVLDLTLPRTTGPRYVAAALDDSSDGIVIDSPAYTLAKSFWDDAGSIDFLIPDSREGWCDSVRLLIDSYRGGPTVRFAYHRIRPKGAPIKGFGGEASGPGPLRKLHRQIRVILEHATRHQAAWTNARLITDIINLVGCCIVAGNVRRSATIALGHPEDASFAELKHYADYVDGREIRQPNYYRRRHGWMSNNSYVLSERHHFEQLVPVIADGIKRNGEPGFLNLKAAHNFGRLGDRTGTILPNGSPLRQETGTGVNPCGEVLLETYELCCLAEWYPSHCATHEAAIRAAEHAAFYTQTVQLLKTHRPETNDVIARNRRTGISLAGAAALRESTTMTQTIKLMEDGYAAIRTENKRLAIETGVPEAIRVTAEKPSGTTSLLMGVPAGCHWPTGAYIRRAARVNDDRPLLQEVLSHANVQHEPDLWSANTEVYYFPVKTAGAETIRPVDQVSMWEQADLAVTLAQHFVDNAVSVTVTFDPLTRAEQARQLTQLLDWYADALSIIPQLTGVERAEREMIADGYLEEILALQKRVPEGDDVERLLASYIGKLKSMSMLPRLGHGYAQAPETAISQEQYQTELSQLDCFDWSRFHGQGVEEVFCSTCVTV